LQSSLSRPLAATAYEGSAALSKRLLPMVLFRLGAITSLAAVVLGTCAGCASPLVQKGLELTGLSAPPIPPEAAEAAQARTPQPRKVTLRIHAGEQLNVNNELRSLSVVLRVYKLKRLEAFSAAPYPTFGQAAAESTAFGSDLVDVREVVLTPGQRHEVIETLPPEAAYLGVVALFRAPAENRWRFAFEARAAAKSGVTLGAHGCALSVAEGIPVGSPVEAVRLAGVSCR
jgi:type VI secretion system protein VasD